MEVGNLEPGHEYKFRVKAVNAEGESDSLDAFEPIIAKNPFDPPGSPSTPEVKDWDKDMVKLAWTKPAKDGGAPITGYLVEKKRKGSTQWSKAATVEGDVCDAKVKGLENGETYQFRVSAINIAGPGEPSEATKPVLVKSRKLAPKIDRRNLNPVSIKAGQAFDFDVKIIGEPPPSVRWVLKDKPVEERSDFTITNIPYNSKLVCDKAQRIDAGFYRIIATNAHGEDVAEIEVSVLAKPSKPEGPLIVSDVNKHGCKLKWNKPKDDGGEPLEGYVIEKEDPETGLWIPVAKTHVPEGEVTGLTPGKSYKFRVKAVNKEGESEPLETFAPVIAKDPYDPPGAPGTPEPTDWNKDHVDLAWKPPESDGNSAISHYIIEKREKGTPKWEKAAEVPGDQTKGTAPFLVEGKDYEFRVIAVNKAGPGEPSEASRTVTAKPRFLAPQIDRKNLLDITIKAGQTIKFDVNIIGEPPPTKIWTINDVEIKPSDRIILNNEDYNTKLVIRRATRAESGKLIITATNSSGRDSANVIVNVQDRPSAPEGPLTVSDVHKEGCKLKWKKPKDDGGVPLEGYLVEKMDEETGKWVPVGKTKDPAMDVTGLVPGKKYKFRARALNKEGESEPLETTETITAKNPFDEPGKPGALEVTDWDKDHIDLKWTAPETDGGSPITGYLVEVKDKLGNWVKAMEVPAGQTTASVPDLVQGQSYEFRVKAVNKAGPGEPSNETPPVVAKPRRLAPKIDRSTLNKIRGRTIESDSRIKIHNEEYSTKIVVRKCRRDDNGTYTLIAENEHGKDEAEVEAVVLDKPSPPGGPLKVEDVTADGCNLEWKPPSDDGGQPVDNYVVEKMDPATGIWTPVGETVGPETSMKVKGLVPGKSYKFRVRAANRQGESEPLEADKTIVAKNPFDEPGKPGTPEIEDYDRDFVKLKWTAPESDGGSPITGYIIEKKDKLNPDWTTVQEVPADQTAATVKDLIENGVYEFRVRAVNKGGPGVPSDSTGQHIAKPKNLAPHIDRNAMINIRQKAGKSFELNVPVSGEPPPKKTWSLNNRPAMDDLRWYFTYEDYRTIVKVKKSLREDSGTLQLTATNSNGSDSAKITIVILDVPLAPKNLSIEEITKESCTVRWNPPDDDGGSDIQHYTVEKKDMETGRWVHVDETVNMFLHTDKLIEMHQYLFRVKAVNREGSSQWAMTRQAIVAKNPFDPPEKPSPPVATDWDSHFIELEWRPPKKDGGSPVTSYVIEKRLKGSPLWDEAARVAGEVTKAKISDLQEGEEYEFRLVAINKAGPSEPSDPTQPITAKPRFLAPIVDRLTLLDQRVRAGRPITYEVAIKGEPPPIASWSINDKPVVGNPRVEVRTTPTLCFFEVLVSVRSDTGKYTLNLENTSGRLSTFATVTVLDRPSPPEGPLDVSEVTKESAVLTWKVPKDDGGCPIKHYLIEKMDASRATWMEAGQTTNLSFKVTHLVHHKKYQFRVIAVNEIGDSDPLEKEDGVVAKDPYEPPSTPGKPEATDWGSDFIELSWTPPKEDGGSPVTGYIIQKKVRGSNLWEKGTEVVGAECKGKVPYLIEGQDYEFRVIALNQGGESQPSEPSELITARPRFLAPKIVTPMKDIEVKTGDVLHIEIKFIGAPTPEITWTVDDKVLESDKRLTVSNYESYTLIHTINAKRTDSGRYTLKLKNDSGTDEGTMKVIVLGKPGAPEGPLEVKDIQKDSVTLAWNPPKDDGGSEIISYVIEKRDKTHNGPWVPAITIPAKTTSGTVPKLVENTNYEFRVKAKNAQGLSVPLTTDRTVLVKNPYKPPSQPGTPEPVDHDHDFIKISWSPPMKDGGSDIIGYDVERRDTRLNRWVQVNRDLVKSSNYTDNTVTDGHLYEYRVTAHNVAGSSEPSAASKPICAKPMKEKPKLHLDGLYGKMIRVRAGDPVYINIPLTGSPIPTIRWTFNTQHLQDTPHTRQEVGDEYVKLTIPKSERADSGLYTITAKNAYGEDSGDITLLINLVNPKGPLEAAEVTNSSVTLKWQKPEDDGGSELTGYIVEKCEIGTDKWLPCGGYCPNPTFVVKGLDEGKQYRFRVRSENIYGISDALESKPITAKNPFDPPDPPSQPKVLDHGPTFVSLAWEPPAHDGYLVEKKEKGTQEWVRVTSFPIPTTDFIVPSLSDGQTYEFRVLAVNDGGIGKPSKPSVPVMAVRKMYAPEAPEAPHIDKITKDSVTLSWQKPNDGGSKILGYYIEKRMKDAKEWDIINNILHKATTFTVPELIEHKEYEFRIIAVNDIGESPPSKPSAMIIVEEQPDKPRIDVGAVKDIVVKAGEEFSITVPFTGFPKPVATWTKNDKDVDETDARIFMKVSDTAAVLAVTNAKRDDTATFKVHLKNKSGFDTCYCRVTVLDKPSPPEDVRAEEIEGESLTLYWQPPKDDGGSVVSNYVVEKKEVGTLTWVRVSSFATTTACRVRNLIVGKQYDFQVMAENQHGTSDPGKTREPILAKLPFDPPGAPGSPQAVETSVDSITLSWQKPRDDGGSPVTGYILEKRDKGKDRWIAACQTTIVDQTFRVTGLKENQEYEFRVAAVNAAGQGPFSSSSDGIFARPPACCPKIDAAFSMRDITVMAGEEFTIRVPFNAFPVPTATWTINGKPLVKTDRVYSEVNVAFTILMNKKARRDDSGNYTLVLKNQHGSDNGACRIKPGPPEGPLEASDITPETCSLSWKPPKDDGGSSITNYVVEKQDANSQVWVKLSSYVRGCHYEVIGLEHKKKYNFRVRAENKYGVGSPLDTDRLITAKFSFDPPGPPSTPNITDYDGVNVSLSWDHPVHDGGSRIQGYNIEYLDMADGRWRVGNEYLVKETHFTIPNLTENHDYQFRIKAKNAAGFGEASEPTATFRLKKKFNPPSPPEDVMVGKVGRSYIELRWEKPRSDGGSKITGYIVERREAGSTFWFKANDFPCAECHYTVMNLMENAEYEFRVFAINAAGKSEPSSTTNPIKVCEVTDGQKPEFVKKLFNKSVALNKHVIMDCEAVGKPSPTARWFKNGREIHSAGRILLTEGRDGEFKLTITDVWDTDEGEYACVVSNSLGSDKCFARMIIAVAPRIERCPTEVFFPEKDNGKVKIYFSGTSPFDVLLFKEGFEIKEDAHIKYTVFDEYVIIYWKEVEKNDMGKYKLTVRNASGSAEADFSLFVTGLPGPPIGPLDVSDITQHTATLAWKVPEYDGGCKITHYVIERKETTHNQWVIAASYCKDTTFTVQGLTENGEYLFRVMAVNENGQSAPLVGLNPIIAKLPFDPPGAPGSPSVIEVGGDFVNLSWAKPEQDGGARILGYWIEKREAGTQTWQKVNQTPCHATQINISNLIEERQYEFRVFAFNEAGIGPAATTETAVKIIDPNAPVAPEFLTPLKKVLCHENKNGQFTCTVVGNPKPNITWYKGVREIFEGTGKYTIMKEGDVHTLVINEVYGEDADEYSIRASNKGGVRTSRAELLIMRPPHINVPPRFRDVAQFEKGENITIKIPFIGYPKPTLKWYRNEEEIEKGGHYDIVIGDRHAVLIIRDVNSDDNGPYRLFAENELGTDSAIIKIKISDRPDKPRDVKADRATDDSVVLSWKAPAWDGGCAIHNYIIERQESPMTSWIRCGNTRLTLHQVTGLNPNKEYRFRVYAENMFGRSDPSDASAPVFTQQSKKERAKRKQVDAQGKKIRGRTEGTISNYDQFVFDIDKYIPQPVGIKTSSVYDYYDILEEIGVGAFGVVHRCKERSTGRVFAAKFIPVSHPMEKTMIKREIDIMNQLHHPKLIRLHDAFEEDDEMILIYEFMSGGELFERITSDGYTMSEAEVINYMRQICEAVKHMHEKNIIHLDLKPENIMCQMKNSNNIKVIDFGLATKLDPNEAVKISTGTAEFAAPEIVEREPVGFYTDMWAVGVLSYVLLSGLSPFAGENDIETLKNVRACDWDFDEDAFANISDQGKDFIRKLLQRSKDKRMTAHECLEHPWLKGETASTAVIERSRYIKFRDSIRARYGDYWFSCVIPLGHISNYSSLRKLQEEKYKIREFNFDRRQAAPRFVIRPQSTFVYEGQAAKFYCRIIAAFPATISWHRDNYELRQSVKYMKRYENDNYYFIINRCKTEDRGEYIIRAENSYGFREEPVFLNVQAIPRDIPHVQLDEPVRKRVPQPKLWDEPADSAPCFTFQLRPRCMQTGSVCKLLCCLKGRPTPTVKWFKDGKELNKYEYNVSHADGVVTLEIVGCTVEDSGRYSCRASNALGEDETWCHVEVEDKKVPIIKAPLIVTPAPSPIPGQKSSYRSTYSPMRDASSYRASSVSRAGGGYSSSTNKYSSDYSSKHSSDYSSKYSSKYSSDYKSSSSYSSSSASRQVQSSSYSSSSTAKKGSDYKSSSTYSSSRLSPTRQYSPPRSSPPSTKRVQKPYGKKTTAEGTSPVRSRTSTRELEIPDDSAMAAPTFKEGLSDLKIKDGEALTLKCAVTGDPDPQIEWFKNDEQLHSSDIIDLKYKNKVATLSIGEVFPEDEGTYVCKATNSLGSVSTSGKLTILPMEKKKAAKGGSGKPPRIMKHLQSRQVKDGDAVTLICTVKCASSFDVVWLHNEKEIKNSKDFQYKTEGDDYKLEIPEIFPEDCGIYTCEVFNDAGEAFSSCTLVVLVPNEPSKGPGFSKFPESQTIHENQPVTFTAELEKDADKVKWTKDGKVIDEKSSHHKVTKSGKKCTLSIEKCASTDKAICDEERFLV
ncbi:twitchin [Caerostris darwini]|uniref:non-specific serine/threonine protein kinase n=1 Tax=Caerostris darwini TaxID=1538125 RepID=A0AAV4V377_9ARAC|nr:twitchin [Caerostris darwini]